MHPKIYIFFKLDVLRNVKLLSQMKYTELQKEHPINNEKVSNSFIL